MSPSNEVTEVLFDEDLGDDVFDIYGFDTRSVDGISQRTAFPVKHGIGSVQPAGTQSLRLLAEGELQEGALDIWTTYRLNSGARGQDADEIVYPSGTGDRYKVMSVADWSAYGEGFVKATCTLMTVEPRLVSVG